MKRYGQGPYLPNPSMHRKRMTHSRAFQTLTDPLAIAYEEAAWAAYRSACEAIKALDPFAAFNAMSRGDVDSAISELVDNGTFATTPDVALVAEHAEVLRQYAENSIECDGRNYFGGVRDTLSSVGLEPGEGARAYGGSNRSGREKQDSHRTLSGRAAQFCGRRGLI